MRDKNTCAGTLAENGMGLTREGGGGGVLTGHYGKQQEIEAKLGDGRTIHSGPSFARLYGINLLAATVRSG